MLDRRASDAAAAAGAPSVAVVVCAFTIERRALLAAAVESLCAQTRAPEEVVVVVDHAPALLEWARSALSGVVVIESGEPRGLSGARNAGIAVTTADIVAFLDDDAEAEPDWLERLAAAYADLAVVGAGGSVVPAWQRRRPRWMPEEFDWVVGCSYRGLPREPAPVRNLIGCNMSFRRAAVEIAGGFDGGLGRLGSDGSGCEETDLCIRLTAACPGAVVLYDPSARVVHQVPAERARVRYFIGRCHAEGRSKAAVARRLGRTASLASERAYTRRTLPAGLRAALGAFARGDPAGLARAGAIVFGFAVTAVGFSSSAVAGRLAR